MSNAPAKALISPVPHDLSGADTDQQLISMWLSGRPATTTRAYKSDLEKFRAFNRNALREITARDLIDYGTSLTDLKPATQRRRLSAVKSLFSFGLRIGYLNFDPAAVLRLPKISDSRTKKLLPPEAIRAIIGAAKNERDSLLIRILYVTGMRIAECMALQQDDISRLNGEAIISVKGKGSKARSIAIPAELADELQAQSESGAVFRTISGPMPANAAYRIVRQAASKAGYTNVSCHWLRHAAASHALDYGASLPRVRDDLGHESLKTTSIYSHAKPHDSIAFYLIQTIT